MALARLLWLQACSTIRIQDSMSAGICAVLCELSKEQEALPYTWSPLVPPPGYTGVVLAKPLRQSQESKGGVPGHTG